MRFVETPVFSKEVRGHLPGSRSRSFCYVDDLVTGMIAMMDQDELLRRCPDSTGNTFLTFSRSMGLSCTIAPYTGAIFFGAIGPRVRTYFGQSPTRCATSSSFDA